MSNGWSPEDIYLVWNKGYEVDGYDPAVWRLDDLGNYIKYNEYSNTDSEYGWEIDHIIRVADGGTDDFYNLRPLQWKANRERG